MSVIKVNLTELERAASALSRSSTALTNEAKTIRSAAHVLSSLQTRNVDRLRTELDQVCQTLVKQAEALGKGDQVLRKLAADLRAVTG